MAKVRSKQLTSTAHDTLKAAAREAVEELLQDRSVPIETTKASLEELYSSIQCDIEALEDDIEAGRT